MSLFRLELFRGGRLVAVREGRNTATVEGLRHHLDLTVRYGTPSPTPTTPRDWYLIPFTAGAITKASTAASNGVTEFTDYTHLGGSLRAKTKTFGSASRGDGTANFRKGNEDLIVLTGNGVLTGCAWATDSAKNGTTGKLWGGAAFNLPVSVLDMDEIRINYTLTAEASDSLGSPY